MAARTLSSENLEQFVPFGLYLLDNKKGSEEPFLRCDFDQLLLGEGDGLGTTTGFFLFSRMAHSAPAAPPA